ncbi:activating signal cointegrator 1 complex subunit 2 [Pectinophora gossypiella]|nr:activating signal cointegrator 1 complex subunit 2 [Pectinophora gossypiella]XP_049876019.1 activating signal cointegrator 1 complex subunit 2 [Pectinophora gossypiella]
MSDKKVNFVNPDCLPVEHVTLTVDNAGVVRQIPALDPYWVEDRLLIVYEKPPLDSVMVFGAVDTWRASMTLYLDNLKWLLSLEHHRFWSVVIYHPKCMDALVSFLQESNPPYMPPYENTEVQTLYGDIRKYIFIVFSRLITNKESKTEWMTKEHMSALIYNKFVFTIPILWDLCLEYGVDNKQHMSRLMASVFTLQPQYETDAKTALAFVTEAFKYIILQVNKDYDSDEPPNLPETFNGFSEIHRPGNSKHNDKLTFNILQDLIIHLLDTAMTLRLFLEVYPKSVKVFRETNFVNSIVQMYEYGIPMLYTKLKEVGDRRSTGYPAAERHIAMARGELVDMFREVLAHYKNAIFSGQDNVSLYVEQYLSAMMDALSERLFMRDYNACYPVHEDIEMLRQAYPEIDTVKTDFILQAIYSNLYDEYSTNQDAMTNGHYGSSSDSDSDSDSDSELESEVENTDNKIPDHLKQESLITEVRDILPHLGDGFILKCLEHYGFDSAKVINRIFEDNLDLCLKDIDPSLPIIPEDPLDKQFLETGVARLNVFDGDEFDVMVRDDVDLSRIHDGKKKSKYADLKDVLADKSEVRNMGDFYSKYSLVCDDSMYSDEYDDSYDAMATPAPVSDNTDMRRPFVTPRALRGRQDGDYEESSEESSEEEEEAQQPSSSSRNRMDFCVNPEEVRARREAAWQARRGKGHRPPPTPKSTDVTGKPKGQGQEKEVLNNRDRKEKHKSSRANHNRRSGAQWKRSQGMMPS